ncbi:alpha-galactosidase [Haoranjiania flava]|uniref:Alpha-galactosidase n=1 Tax=Haoranjiania flava TaxID=1856322 RepID=A0AAE3IPF7_9BACT|nr:alpha-galactosidase [Haoranjiania flava]MCU7694716.1 alpha-galactosidase [Haoranjiania flava]
MKIHLLIIAYTILISFQGVAQVRTVAENHWLLETENMYYSVKVINKQLYSGYYGAAFKQNKYSPDHFTGREEIPVRGKWTDKLPIIEVIFNDGTRDLDLIYESSFISKKDGYSQLEIRMKDSYYPIKVTSFYRVLPEFDIIEKWIEISNKGKSMIKIENAMSGSLWLPLGSYKMTHLAGNHLQDFQPHTTLLTHGTKTIQSKDFKTYGASYFTVRPEGEKDEHNGDVWYGQLHYSGNWRTDFESNYEDRLQIVSGINFWDSEWNLRPAETFTTPVFSFGFTSKGTGAAARNYHNYIRNITLPQQRAKKARPVISNSWYATEFNINEQQQVALAKVAKEIGVEMFVIDDGWFKGRVNDKAGLGDWTVDQSKFPNGLNPMIKQINDLGLDFGIWIEPEMVNPNSDLYRAHPDWVLHFNNRNRTEGRNQLILNLARKDVYDYLYESFHDLLKNHNIKYVKWDMNKSLTEPGWPSAPTDKQREVRIRYIENMYRMFDELTKAFPDVWFETCSSGGGRVDLGIFTYTDAAWVSDNIDPVDRIYLQYGYLNAFPANTMISWTGDYDNHNIKPSMEFMFDVAMSGVLGIGNNMTKWNGQEKEIAKRKIAEYKQIRDVVHNGDIYRIASPFESSRCVLQYNSKDKNESVIFCYELNTQLLGSSTYPNRNPYLKLMGLDANKRYQFEGEKDIYTGDQLMSAGLRYPLWKAATSKILRLKAL